MERAADRIKNQRSPDVFASPRLTSQKKMSGCAQVGVEEGDLALNRAPDDLIHVDDVPTLQLNLDLFEPNLGPRELETVAGLEQSLVSTAENFDLGDHRDGEFVLGSGAWQ